MFSVESIYYHPEIQRRVTQRQAAIIGGDAAARLTEAKSRALSGIAPHVQRLSERIAEKVVREQIFEHLPRREDIIARQPIDIAIDVGAAVAAERTRLQGLVDAGDLVAIVERYPVRETPALPEIARRLGFQNQRQYEAAVLKLLSDDDASLAFVRSLFGTLAADIQAP